MSSLNQTLVAEWFKIKKSKIWYFAFVLMIAPVLYGVIIHHQIVIGKYHYNKENPWYMLIMMVQLFYGTIFLPVIVSVIVGTLINYEKNANNWERISLIPIKKYNFYVSKIIWMAIIILLTQLFMIAIIIMYGLTLNYGSYFPIKIFSSLFLLGTMGAISLGTLSFYIFLCIKSNRLSLIICIILSFPTFLILSNPPGSWTPTLYPWALPFFGMTQATTNSTTFIAFIIACSLVLIIFSLLSIKRMKKHNL